MLLPLSTPSRSQMPHLILPTMRQRLTPLILTLQQRSGMSLLGLVLELHLLVPGLIEETLGYRRARSFEGLLENVPVRDGAEGAFHV